MLLRAKDGRVRTIDQLDLRELYQLAATAYKQKRYTQSIQLYEIILTYYPIHRHLFAALYNQALAYEDSGDIQKAIPLYLRVIQQHADQKQIALNATFRLAACYAKQKQWKKAFSLYDKLLQSNLSDEDRLDALAYAGESLFYLEQHAQALPFLRLAVALHRRRSNLDGSISYPAAMSQYYWARIYHLRFLRRPFRLPQSLMKEDLDDKARNLLRAQSLYLDAIRLRHAEWALAAVYQIGKMYEEMHDHMINAPIPAELNQEEREIYNQELRKRIKILLDKALVTYYRNLLLAQRIGIQKNDWKARTDQRFQELLAFYSRSFGAPPLLSSLQKATSQPTSKPATKSASQPTTQAKSPVPTRP
jgi:pentatricopeptide repeat protein